MSVPHPAGGPKKNPAWLEQRSRPTYTQFNGLRILEPYPRNPWRGVNMHGLAIGVATDRYTIGRPDPNGKDEGIEEVN